MNLSRSSQGIIVLLKDFNLDHAFIMILFKSFFVKALYQTLLASGEKTIKSSQRLTVLQFLRVLQFAPEMSARFVKISQCETLH